MIRNSTTNNSNNEVLRSNRINKRVLKQKVKETTNRKSNNEESTQSKTLHPKQT